MDGPTARTVSLAEVMPDLLPGAWERLNRLAFNGEMQMPVFQVVPLANSAGTYSWNNDGTPGTIRIDPSIFEGNPLDVLGIVADVLLHEMTHQYVSEIKRKFLVGDGPVFRRELQAAHDRLKEVQP